jgi:hypothetical protein
VVAYSDRVVLYGFCTDVAYLPFEVVVLERLEDDVWRDMDASDLAGPVAVGMPVRRRGRLPNRCRRSRATLSLRGELSSKVCASGRHQEGRVDEMGGLKASEG